MPIGLGSILRRPGAEPFTEHPDSVRRLPLGTMHNQCMWAAIYGLGEPDEGHQERLRRALAAASAYGAYAARMTSDRLTRSFFQLPEVTPHGLRVTAHFAWEGGLAHGSQAPERLVTVKPRPSGSLTPAHMLDALAAELADFARNRATAEDQPSIDKILDRASGEPSGLHIDSQWFEGWSLRAGETVGIVCRFDDRAVMWLAIEPTGQPPAIFTEDTSTLVRGTPP